jgi:hypothetical protein
MKIKISEVQQVFKDLFEGGEEDASATSVDIIYELSPEKDYYKMVISIQGLETEDVSVIHTKFIFKVDLEKKEILENSFIYLFDINCVYHKIEFDNVVNLKQKILDIIESRDFGQDLQILSDFIEAPAMFLNYYMRRSKITDYSIFDVEYDPKFKVTPCDKTTFDFKVNINNNYEMEISIWKIEKQTEEEVDSYKYQFRLMDDITTFETDTLKNLHYFMGEHIAKLLDKKLKNK